LKNQDRGDTFIFTTSQRDEKKLKELKSRGIKIAVVKENKNRVDIEEAVRELGKLEIMNLLVEGGGEVIGSFFEKKLVDKIYLFLAPRIIGGKKSITWVEGKGVKFLKETSYIKIDSLKKIENDLLLEGYVKASDYTDS